MTLRLFVQCSRPDCQAIARLTEADLGDPYVFVAAGLVDGAPGPVGVTLDGRWAMPVGWSGEGDDAETVLCPRHVRPSA